MLYNEWEDCHNAYVDKADELYRKMYRKMYRKLEAILTGEDKEKMMRGHEKVPVRWKV